MGTSIHPTPIKYIAIKKVPLCIKTAFDLCTLLSHNNVEIIERIREDTNKKCILEEGGC